METNNNINIAKILCNMPKGTKLYSTLYGDVELQQIEMDKTYPVVVKYSDYQIRTFSEEGLFFKSFPEAECQIFPSRKMRDWTKFFKRGDVVYSKAGNISAIFEGWVNDDYTEFNTTINFYVADASYGKEEVCYTDCFVKASDEERAVFIANAEKHYKGKYNPDTLQVEPVKPTCPFKPFDKVLVRDNDEGEWYANYFSHYKENNDCPYVCIDNSYIYCIPYEGNEHLLGTSEAYTEGGSE